MPFKLAATPTSLSVGKFRCIKSIVFSRSESIEILFAFTGDAPFFKMSHYAITSGAWAHYDANAITPVGWASDLGEPAPPACWVRAGLVASAQVRQPRPEIQHSICQTL